MPSSEAPSHELRLVLGVSPRTGTKLRSTPPTTHPTPCATRREHRPLAGTYWLAPTGWTSRALRSRDPHDPRRVRLPRALPPSERPSVTSVRRSSPSTALPCPRRTTVARSSGERSGPLARTADSSSPGTDRTLRARETGAAGLFGAASSGLPHVVVPRRRSAVPVPAPEAGERGLEPTGATTERAHGGRRHRESVSCRRASCASRASPVEVSLYERFEEHPFVVRSSVDRPSRERRVNLAGATSRLRVVGE